MIEGHATPAGTLRFSQRFQQMPFSTLGKTDLQVSAVGYGGYRVSIGQKLQERTLSHALQAGINLIDTSANYADGGSERMMGKVLRELLETKEIERDEVVVVSKVGYLQGENLRISADRRQKGKAFPDLVHFDEELEHCIHPEFLADQLNRSLSRLGMNHIDVYLLHNPEYFLKWAANEGWELKRARASYEARLALAFDYLEGEVQAGRIGAYGMSSNSLPFAAEHREFTPLEPFLRKQKRFPNFKVVQFPMNLYENAAATLANQNGGKTLLQLCRRYNLGVLINRPLNAIRGSQLMRLADPISYLPAASPHRAAFETRVGIIRERIAAFEPKWVKATTFSQLAIRALRSTEGISSVLVGMRKQEYVQDVMEELLRPIKRSNRIASWKAMSEIWD